jgi:hypothetical protein
MDDITGSKTAVSVAEVCKCIVPSVHHWARTLTAMGNGQAAAVQTLPFSRPYFRRAARPFALFGPMGSGWKGPSRASR